MFDGVRIGNYENPDSLSEPKYHGNDDITIDINATDTNYAVAAYLASNLNIKSESIGTATGEWGAHRAVYISGSKHVYVESKSKNMNVSDGAHLVTSAPSVSAPYNVGCEDVEMHIEDMGATRYVFGQILAKIGVVFSPKSTTKVTHKNIIFHVNATTETEVWNRCRLFAVGSVGQGATHSFENIILSGTFDRTFTRNNNVSAIYVHPFLYGNEGLGYLDLKLQNFHDIYNEAEDSKPLTIRVHPKEPKVTIHAYNSTVHKVELANTTVQNFTNIVNKNNVLNQYYVMIKFYWKEFKLLFSFHSFFDEAFYNQ